MLKTFYASLFFASVVVDVYVDFAKHISLHGLQNTFLIVFGLLWIREEVVSPPEAAPARSRKHI